MHACTGTSGTSQRWLAIGDYHRAGFDYVTNIYSTSHIQGFWGLLGHQTYCHCVTQPNPNPNHCVAIVPKLQDLVLLQYQVSPGFLCTLKTNSQL